MMAPRHRSIAVTSESKRLVQTYFVKRARSRDVTRKTTHPNMLSEHLSKVCLNTRKIRRRGIIKGIFAHRYFDMYRNEYMTCPFNNGSRRVHWIAAVRLLRLCIKLRDLYKTGETSELKLRVPIQSIRKSDAQTTDRIAIGVIDSVHYAGKQLTVREIKTHMGSLRDNSLHSVTFASSLACIQVYIYARMLHRFCQMASLGDQILRRIYVISSLDDELITSDFNLDIYFAELKIPAKKRTLSTLFKNVCSWAKLMYPSPSRRRPPKTRIVHVSQNAIARAIFLNTSIVKSMEQTPYIRDETLADKIFSVY